jgi:hypothetical protein
MTQNDTRQARASAGRYKSGERREHKEELVGKRLMLGVEESWGSPVRTHWRTNGKDELSGEYFWFWGTSKAHDKVRISARIYGALGTDRQWGFYCTV